MPHNTVAVVGAAETTASTATYVGYGDPTGMTGAISPPDSTITTDLQGSGLQRLALVSDADGDWRLAGGISRAA